VDNQEVQISCAFLSVNPIKKDLYPRSQMKLVLTLASSVVFCFFGAAATSGPWPTHSRGF
jgi:hypothetical protein